MSGFKVVDLSVVISIFMRGKTMISKRLAGIGVLIFALVMGCAGNYGNFKRQTRSESKATKQQLIHNWSDYDIWLHAAYKPPRITIIIFDPKNDNRKISVGSNWRMVKDQQMWTEIVKENTASDGEFTLVWQEICSRNYIRFGLIKLNIKGFLTNRVISMTT